MSELDEYIRTAFKIEPETFLKALRLSPNAQGYLVGAVTELVLRDTYLVPKGYEVKRIREKWVGQKHPHHRGDFYIRKDGSSDWYVLESKGLKSNSEKWNGLFNRARLVSFLDKHRHLTPFSATADVEAYITEQLPKFDDEYSLPLYGRDDIAEYQCSRVTPKSKRIAELSTWTPERLEQESAARIAYLRSKLNVVETHFVSGGSKIGKRTQATPRADEFNVIAVNLFLRSGAHDFVFVNPKDLPRSTKDSNHLQQNYVVDILVDGQEPDLGPPWSRDLATVIDGLSDPVSEVDMQVDDRSLDEIADEIAALGAEPA